MAWALAEGPDMMSGLIPDLLKYGRHDNTLVVVLSYGPRLRTQAARIFDERVRWIDQASDYMRRSDPDRVLAAIRSTLDVMPAEREARSQVG